MKLGKLIRFGAALAGVRGVRSTYRPRIGPLTLNTSARTGLSSVSVGVGPVRAKLWDRRGHTGVSSVDLPGPISWRPSQKKRAPETRPQAPMTMNPNGREYK